jgi:serralysin
MARRERTADDNLPRHSGLDDGPLHDLNDDNLPRHSGLDEGPLHDLNDDRVRGRDGDDRLTGRNGDDHRDGGAGIDTAVFRDDRASYSITRVSDDAPGRLHVSGADSGSDLLDNIERLQFADQKLAFDLQTGQAAGNTVKLIGAAFGARAIHERPDYVGAGLSLFDAGYSLHEVAELAAKAMSVDDNDAFVDTVYKNVVGAAPTQEIHDYLESLLHDHGGTMTRGDLLAFAAHTDSNAQQIDLTGLQQTGIEYV